MPLYQQYSALRVFKARRKVRRSTWQDVIPEDQNAKDTYRIAEKHESSFSRAFLKAVRETVPSKPSQAFKEAFAKGSVVEAISTLPLFDDVQDDETEQKFRSSLDNAYAAILQESGEDATKVTNRELDTELAFSIFPPNEDEVEIIEKASLLEQANTAGRKRVRALAQGMVVPINPHSIKWMKQQSAKLIVQIAEQDRVIIQEILSDAFEKGLRMEHTYKSIKKNIGLTNRDFKAVLNRQDLLEDQGLSKANVEKWTNKYRDELLKKRSQRIARTETIQAQSQGRLDAWRSADEAGQLPPVEREWLTSPPSPNPDRPCEICLELDGKRTPVQGTYTTIEGDSISGPPAHPHCRCSERLVRAGTKPREAAQPARQIAGRVVDKPKRRMIAMPPKKLMKDEQ